ncbi:uncharacterized protein LOC128269768 [Anopheles cruzii]|uniref:uncharacterized protein LOC128269768 n=1 Tax=Anopheles cruzii TaxID=68878 RepID=UPI0022EC7AC1|nr:uncharacterized protein LOC128269768 [Anopheles cruzii]
MDYVDIQAVESKLTDVTVTPIPMIKNAHNNIGHGSSGGSGNSSNCNSLASISITAQSSNHRNLNHQTVATPLHDVSAGALALTVGSNAANLVAPVTTFNHFPNNSGLSKYAQLLMVIEEMGRDLRPTYSGSRNSAERLKRLIVHARILVRECLVETERSARHKGSTVGKSIRIRTCTGVSSTVTVSSHKICNTARTSAIVTVGRKVVTMNVPQYPPPNGCYTDIKQGILAYTMPLRTDLGDIPGPPVSLLPETDDSKGGSSKKKRRAYVNESEEARARRLARNAERMRQKRATETEEEYRLRLSKNAESNRRKRLNETELERTMRHARSAARERLRRAMETPEQRAVRLAKLAERMRSARANETAEQRAVRLSKNATKAKERLLKESPEQWIERKRKKAEYARRKRSGHSLQNSSAGSSSSNDAAMHSVLSNDPTSFGQVTASQLAHGYLPHLDHHHHQHHHHHHHPSLTATDNPPDVKDIKLIASPKPEADVPEHIYSTPQLPFLSTELKPPEFRGHRRNIDAVTSSSRPSAAAAAAAAAAVAAVSGAPLQQQTVVQSPSTGPSDGGVLDEQLALSKSQRRFLHESPEARAKRLARNAERMRQKRAAESEDEYRKRMAQNAERMRRKRAAETEEEYRRRMQRCADSKLSEDYRMRLSKNAERNRRRRQNETEMERTIRRARSAARERLRRAMETPEQRGVRLAKLAERMRVARANELPEQRAMRLAKNAAKAKERLQNETPEQWIDRKRKKAEYARHKRSVGGTVDTGGPGLSGSASSSVSASTSLSVSSNGDTNGFAVAGNPVYSGLDLHQPLAHHPSTSLVTSIPSTVDLKDIKLIATCKPTNALHLPEQLYATSHVPFLGTDPKPPEFLTTGGAQNGPPIMQPDLYKLHILPYSFSSPAVGAMQQPMQMDYKSK